MGAGKVTVYGGKEERAMHSSSTVFYHPGQPARSVRPSQSVQQAQLCCRQHCWEQKLGMGESKYLDSMDIGWKCSTISGWLTLRDIHARQKINYSIHQALWAGRITSQYLEPLLGVVCVCMSTSVCMPAYWKGVYTVDIYVYRQQEIVYDCRHREGVARVIQK